MRTSGKPAPGKRIVEQMRVEGPKSAADSRVFPEIVQRAGLNEDAVNLTVDRVTSVDQFNDVIRSDCAHRIGWDVESVDTKCTSCEVQPDLCPWGAGIDGTWPKCESNRCREQEGRAACVTCYRFRCLRLHWFPLPVIAGSKDALE